MKVYRFYKRPEYDSLYHEYRLYALTNKKEYAKMFRETRNMNIFVEKSSKVSKDEWKSIIDDSRGAILTTKSLITKNIEDGIIGTKHVEITLTDYEYECCNDEEFSMTAFLNDHYWANSFGYKMFKSEIVEALRVLEYVRMYKIYNNDPSMDDEDDYYDAPDISIDEFSAFILMHSETFK